MDQNQIEEFVSQVRAVLNNPDPTYGEALRRSVETLRSEMQKGPKAIAKLVGMGFRYEDGEWIGPGPAQLVKVSDVLAATIPDIKHAAAGMVTVSCLDREGIHFLRWVRKEQWEALLNSPCPSALLAVATRGTTGPARE